MNNKLNPNKAQKQKTGVSILTRIKTSLSLMDKPVLGMVLFLNIFGLLAVYSAGQAETVETPPLKLLLIQTVASLIGLCLMFVVSVITNNFFSRKGPIIFYLLVIAILMVGIMFFGTIYGGARSWYEIGSLNFQPSEILKVPLIIAQAYLMVNWGKVNWSRLKDKNLSLKGSYPEKDEAIYQFFLLALGVLCMVALFLQPDYGMFLLNLANIILLLMVYKFSFKTNIIIYIVCILTYLLTYQFIDKFGANLVSSGDHFFERLAIFTNPFNYDEHGYQHTMGFQAIASGGLFGRGIGEGVVKYYVPAGHTDFIITIIAEEFGLIVAVLIVVIELLVAIRMFYMATKAKSSFRSIVMCGIGGMFLFQTIVNIAGALSFIPLTGITLPFVSYGGSSLVALYFSLGVYQNFVIEEKRQNYISRKVRKEVEDEFS